MCKYIYLASPKLIYIYLVLNKKKRADHFMFDLSV